MGLNTPMAKLAFSKLKRLLFWVKSHKFYSLLILIVLLVAGYFVYDKIALELNKRAFQNARVAIDTVYADIVKEVGQPDDFKHENFCSRPNVTFGEGPLSCDVSTTFIYGVADMDDANRVFKKTQITISTYKKLKPTKPLLSSITSVPVGDVIYSSATDYYKMSGVDCITSYWYDTPRQIELAINHKNKKPLEISLSCNNWARAQFYSTK